MARETLEAEARHAFLNINSLHGVDFKWRPRRADASEATSVIPPETLKLPLVLRLTRRGSTLRAEYSRDAGRHFQPAGAPVAFDPPLPPALAVGLAISSINVNQTTEAQFQDIEIRP
jgi:hypothetical protein